MKKVYWGMCVACCLTILFLAQCTEKPRDFTVPGETPDAEFGGFESQAQWGRHLVTICGCHDCHTPKKMTPEGPVLDSTLLLSGHPAQMPPPDVDRKYLESNGFTLANPMLTSWVGPWGVSFTGNLTSDETGIGTWQEAQFMTAIRKGKLKGLEAGRSLLPPMPWDMYRNMTDDELKAIFAFLKTTTPVKNVVPQPLPPVTQM